MNTPPFPRGPVTDASPDPDAWSQSLMGRTEELAHLQAQTPQEAEPAESPAPQAQPRKRTFQAPPPPPPPSPLAAVLKLCGAAAGLLAASLLVLPALRHFGAPPVTPEEVAAARPETTLAPSFDPPSEVREGEVREQRAFMEGASLLMVDSAPSGATVFVNGRTEGATPLSVTLECVTDAPVTVKLTRRGFSSLEHTLPCRHDTMTQLFGRLRKGKSSAKP
ncbi:PEGA domain-containing protein [Myxococcus xanthus]|uniref:PEGA domain-containing protein n=1 Tax=Myxococcus xanthus TaxID=34 RepID=A0A7Y4MSM4_MYXXA|nr:PEGA domain-containing protein [Myxococcus xanthus]NOJ85889.1 PEGA domain-containing protein [Myxococcus xanthus]